MLVGAGGIASQLLPTLIRTFKPETITIYDRDRLEARNFDRQLFPPAFEGMFKGEAMAEMFSGSKTKIIAKREWFDSSTLLSGDLTGTVLLCCADNHMARKAVLDAADKYSLTAVIGGNMYFDADAYIYFPHNKDNPEDPRIRYPEILTDTTGSPIAPCTGPAQEASPQLAIANMMAATHMLHLLWLYFVVLPGINPTGEEQVIALQIPHEFSTTIYGHGSRETEILR